MCRVISGFWLVLFLAGVFPACRQNRHEAPAQPPAPIPGGELRLLLEKPGSLDPIRVMNYSESTIVLQLFDGLLRLDENLNLAPALALDWQVSANGLNYLFRLRQDARFHNGRLVTSADCVYSLTRLLDPRWNSLYSAHYQVIQGSHEFATGKKRTLDGLQAPSPHLLQITLERPYAPFLVLLAMENALVVPREEVEKDYQRFCQHPTGSGPFLFEHRGDEEIRLKANRHYFLGRPFLDHIHIRTVPLIQSDFSFELLEAGKVDVSFVPPDQIEEARGCASWRFFTQPVLRLAMLGFNFRNAAVHNRVWRRRIAEVIDPAQIIGELPNYVAIQGLIPFSLSGPHTTHRAGASANPPYAQSECPSGAPKKPASLIFCYVESKTEARRLIHSRIIQALTAGGNQVKTIPVSSVSELFAQVKSGRPHLFLTGESLDYPDPHALLFRLFYSKSEGNIFRYQDSQTDQLLKQAEMSLDENKRILLYREIERRLLEEAAVIPLFSANYSIALRKEVHGMNFNPLGFEYLPLRNVWIEKTD